MTNGKLSETTTIFNEWRNLTAADLIVYIAVDQKPTTQKDVAAATGMSDRQVRRSAGALCGLGLIVSEKSGRSVVYATNTGLHESGVEENPLSDSGLMESGVAPKSGHMESGIPHVLHTTTNNNTDNQLTLIENETAQNLGNLDIQSQELLNSLGINPHVTQKFKNAPKLVRKYSPARILMLHDPDCAIAQNLKEWADAYRSDTLDLRYNGRDMSPALIWARIVEMQAPPIRKQTLTFAEIETLEQNRITPEEELWGSVLTQLQSQMTRTTFSVMSGSKLVSITEGGECVIRAGSPYNREKLEARLSTTIERAISSVIGAPVFPTFTN